MENNIKNEYVTFAFSNIHNTLQENIHEEICDEVTQCVLPNDLTEVTVVNVNAAQYNDNNHISIEIITDKNDVDEDNTIVYPLYIKEEEHYQQQQQQQRRGDESVAVEALRQLGGTYTPSLFKIDNVKCMNCYQEFAQNDYENHKKLCKTKNLSCTTCNETFDRLTDLNNHIVCHQTDRPHSCRTCGNLFRTKTLLNSHMKAAHKIGKLYKCTVCDEEFMRPSSLSNHMKIHSYTPGRAIKDNNNTTYDLIQAKVTDNDDKNFIEIHINNEEEEDADDPSIPSTSSSSSNNNPQNYETINTWPNSTYTLINNNQNTTSTITNNQDDNDNNYAISEFTVMPNGDVTQTYGYTETIQQEEQETLSIPENTICNNNNNNNNIVKKSKITKEKQQYLCDKCGINFNNISSFKNHEKIHRQIKNNGINDDNDDDLPIDCKYCDKQYENNEHLMIHHKTCIKKLLYDNKNNKIINNKYNKHACIECGKKFTTKQKMYRHQWIHRKKTWICEQCGKQYEKQVELDEHRISMHPGVSPYTCNDCGKCFVSRQGLWEHGRTHAGSPAHFHCDECGKTFSSRQGYLIHHRTHTGERPYGCQYCWKAFRDGGTLRKHERIHTGERPHVCPICKRAFNQKVVLREHVRWVHAASKNNDKNSTPPYPCPLCNYINQDRDELCAHIVKHSDQIIADAKAKVTNVQTTKTTTTSSTTSTKRSNNVKKSTKNKKYKKLKTDNEQMMKINNIAANNNGGTLLLVTTDKTADKTADNIDNNTCTITIDNNDTFVLPCTSQGYRLHDHELSTLLLQSNSNHNENQTIHFINENNTIQIIESGGDNNLPIIIDQNNHYNSNDLTEIIIKDNDDSYEIMESDAIELFDNYDYDDDDLSCKLCGDNFNDKNILMEHIKEHTNVHTK